MWIIVFFGLLTGELDYQTEIECVTKHGRSEPVKKIVPSEINIFQHSSQLINYTKLLLTFYLQEYFSCQISERISESVKENQMSELRTH